MYHTSYIIYHITRSSCHINSYHVISYIRMVYINTVSSYIWHNTHITMPYLLCCLFCCTQFHISYSNISTCWYFLCIIGFWYLYIYIPYCDTRYVKNDGKRPHEWLQHSSARSAGSAACSVDLPLATLAKDFQTTSRGSMNG